jgi:Kef-type K+ transport system membrane component KefB
MDDEAEADGDPETRERYRELLEELRTILPGVQVLFAFLLTAPFSARFTELDEFGRDLYTAGLVGTALAMVVFLAPTSYHRIAPRRARADRLRSAIRMTVTGMLILAGSVSTVVYAVLRFIFGSDVANVVTILVAGAIVVLWYGVPLLRRANMIRD